MSLRKYQKVEDHEVVSREGHDIIDDELRKTGKNSVAEMTDKERRDTLERIASVETK